MIKNDTTPSIKSESSISMPPKRVNKKALNIRKSVFYIVIILLVVSLYGSFHYYSKYKSLTVDPNIEAQRVTESMVQMLGKLMELPIDEVPTVATISDKEKLAGQPFFKSAENGDILFAYTTAMKAILYRPSANKIINVAPISINQSAQNTAITSGVTTPVVSASTTKNVKK